MKPTHKLIPNNHANEYLVYFDNQEQRFIEVRYGQVIPTSHIKCLIPIEYIPEPVEKDQVFHEAREKLDTLQSVLLKGKEQEPETFDWKRAAKLWADGVKLEAYYGDSWIDFTCDNKGHSFASFNENRQYRIKPVSPVVEECWMNWYKPEIGVSHPSRSLHQCKSIAGTETVLARLHITTHDNVPVAVEILKP